MEKDFVCIVCPRGCRLHVDTDGTNVQVSGNSCPRGAAFAVSELTDPRRSVTTTVRTTRADFPMLPVRTDGEIPKAMVAEAVRRLGLLKVTPPVRCGDEVLGDLLGTGVSVIATEDFI